MNGRLTRRQEEIAALLKTGASNRKIGAELGITPESAALAVSRIYDKLNIPRRGRGRKVRILAIRVLLGLEDVQ